MTEKPPKPLSVRHEAFCQGIAKGKSATQAYIHAGYHVSDKVAGVEGHKLLKKPSVEQRISELRKRNEEAGELTRPEFMRLVGNHARNGSVAAARLYAECAGFKEPEKIEMKTEIEVGPNTLAQLESRAAAVAAPLSILAARAQTPASAD